MIFENEDLNNPRFQQDKDIKLITYGDMKDYEEAFKNQDNYGIYLAQVRKSKPEINKALEDYFGPSVPTRKINAEKARGEPFPPKTKQAIDDFIKNITTKLNILKYNKDGKNLIFPKHQNPEKNLTKKIIKTVMDNAGLEYKLEDVGDIEEMKTMKKSTLRKIIKEEMNSMSLSKKIDDAITSIDPDMPVDLFAEAVAEVLKDQYGSHNYSEFINTLRKKLNNA